MELLVRRHLQAGNHARAFCQYQDFVDKGKLLTNYFFKKGNHKANLLSTVKKFCKRHHDLVDPYNMDVSKLVSDLMTSVEAVEA